MDKRYQVFVSSTFDDLQDERKEVMQALLEIDCIPSGMELFPASDEDQWSVIKRIIDDSDYYLLILAGRYGSTNKDGIGYTEMEYRYALETQKPIISFLHKNPGEIPNSKTESKQEGKDKLERFRELVQQKMVKYWINQHDLGSVVSRSMNKLIKEKPAAGWIKANDIFNENAMETILKLRNENEELKMQINKLNHEAPKRADILSQANENIEIHCEVECNFEYDTFTEEIISFFTWNEMFLAIAPYLINDISDTKVKVILSNYMMKKLDRDLERFRKEEYFQYLNFTIVDYDFQLVKIQLRALGLIQLNEHNGDWRVTEYGDSVMSGLLLMKR